MIMEIFKEICAIPHCSFKTDKLREYIIAKAQSCGASVEVDKVGNIVAKKGNPQVCLQSHYDMVCIGDAPNIVLIEEGNILRAKNSSLGADNGIGCAIMLDLLTRYEDIELLFTSDEEVGLIGASNLDIKLSAKYLLNLDSEEEGDIFIGCAGGVEFLANKEITYECVEGEWFAYALSSTGFVGGHSGVDADKNIKNAIKELAYFLSQGDIMLCTLKGGEANNAIPKKVQATILSKTKLESSEFIQVDELEKIPEKYVTQSKEIISFLNAMPTGVSGYDSNLNIVQTSSNLAIVELKKESFYVELFPRSMSEDDMKRLKTSLDAILKSYGFSYTLENEYPAWKPFIGKFAQKVHEISKKDFPNSRFTAIHAGLEAGIIVANQPNLEAVSIGPNIFYPHSNREYVELNSVKKVSLIVESVLKCYQMKQ